MVNKQNILFIDAPGHVCHLMYQIINLQVLVYQNQIHLEHSVHLSVDNFQAY